MANTTLSAINDTYKGKKIGRVNGRYHNPDTLVKYKVTYKGTVIYFKTQKDVKDFIDKIQ